MGECKKEEKKEGACGPCGPCGPRGFMGKKKKCMKKMMKKCMMLKGSKFAVDFINANKEIVVANLKIATEAVEAYLKDNPGPGCCCKEGFSEKLISKIIQRAVTISGNRCVIFCLHIMAPFNRVPYMTGSIPLGYS